VMHARARSHSGPVAQRWKPDMKKPA
jgi:hypothetical protein